MKTQDEILTFIRNQVPRGHFEEILTIIPQAFQKAHQAAGELVNIPKGRKRAQDRYSFLQDGLAGLSRTWSSSVTTTQPAGEFYLLTMGNIKSLQPSSHGKDSQACEVQAEQLSTK